MTADELQDRLIDFAVRILGLADALPNTPAGRHVKGQIVRCGTSPAPNYGEARGAESTADFRHKLGIVLKELNETEIWLQVILRSEMLKIKSLVDIIDENSQLCKIIASTISTAKAKRGRTEISNDKSQISNLK